MKWREDVLYQSSEFSYSSLDASLVTQVLQTFLQVLEGFVLNHFYPQFLSFY